MDAHDTPLPAAVSEFASRCGDALHDRAQALREARVPAAAWDLRAARHALLASLREQSGLPEALAWR